jgi:hypothetical protein
MQGKAKMQPQLLLVELNKTKEKKEERRSRSSMHFSVWHHFLMVNISLSALL